MSSPTAGRSMGGMLILRLISQAAVFGTMVVLSRLLGPEQFGIYSYIFSGFLLFFTLFNVNGLNDILVREMATDAVRREQIYRCGLSLKLIACLTGCVASAIIIFAFNVLNVPLWISLIATLTLFTSFSMGSFRMVWDVPYQVDFRMIPASNINLFSKSLLFVLILAWALFWKSEPGFSWESFMVNGINGGVAAVVLLQIFSESIGMGVQAGVNRRYGYSMLPMWNRDIIRGLLHEVWPLAIAGVFMLIISRINLLMMPLFLTDRDIGLYNAPLRLVEALYIIPTVFVFTVMPILSRAIQASASEFRILLRLSFKLMLAISLALASVIGFYSEEIILLINGRDYIDSAPVLGLFIWVGVLSFSVIVLHTAIISAGRQRFLMVLYAIQAAVAVTANLILIPKYGIVGSTWAMILTYFILFPSILLFKKIRYIVGIWFGVLPLPLALAVVCGLGAKHFGLNLWVAVFTVPLLYLSLLYLSGWLNRRDLSRVADLVRLRNVNPGKQ